jgi:hypothetical protein
MNYYSTASVVILSYCNRMSRRQMPVRFQPIDIQSIAIVNAAVLFDAGAIG